MNLRDIKVIFLYVGQTNNFELPMQKTAENKKGAQFCPKYLFSN